VARFTWGAVGYCLGADNIPRHIQQYKSWIARWLPGRDQMHTSGCATICWAIWKCQNKVCFDKKNMRNPSEIIICACSFLTYWTCLHDEATQARILDGVQQLLACTHKVLATHSGGSATRRLLPPPDEAQEDDGSNF